MVKASPMPKAPESSVDADAPKPAVFVLLKSHGLIIQGEHKLWPAGTEFSSETDGATLTLLAQSGAELEQK